MQRHIAYILAGFFLAFFHVTPAVAGQIDAKKLASIELRGISLQTAPTDVGAILSGNGFEIIEGTGGDRPVGVTYYRRVDPLLGDEETIDIEQDGVNITHITHNRTFPKSDHPKGSWQKYVHATEIEYALALLCDPTAKDSRDCKDSALLSAPDMTTLLIEARRVGDFQQKILASFRAMHAGYTWHIKRATLNE